MSKLAAVSVSTSLALVATSAMASVQGEVVEIPKDYKVSAETEAKIDAAMAKRNVRDAVSSVFGAVTTTFSEDGQVLDQKYFPEKTFADQIVERTEDNFGAGEITLAATRQDSTDIGRTSSSVGCYGNCHSNCHGNCHGNCHSNCHGSRGWR
jgi:hypothetical protein